MNLKPDPGFWKRLQFMAAIVGILIGLLLVTISACYYIGTVIGGLLVMAVALIIIAWRK